MAYTNAIFYLDLESGSDAARPNLIPSNYADNGSGLVRITVGSLGTPSIATGGVVTISNTTGDVYSGAWKVTVIDPTTIDLQASTYTSNPAAKGNIIPRGGSSLADAFKTYARAEELSSNTLGDEVRVKATRSGLLGNATWTNLVGRRPSQNIASSTNATPIVVTINNHGYVAGNTVFITGHTVNTNANGMWTVGATTANTFALLNGDDSNSVGNGVGGASGTVTDKTAMTVLLDAPVTKNVALTGNRGTKVAWTCAANVTSAAVTGDSREGDGHVTITIAAGFTTGLAAWYPTGTLDLSAYQVLCYWMMSSVASTSNYVAIALCSDSAGAVPVHTFNMANAPFGQYKDYAHNNGSALSSNINSIALYINTDYGATTITINNVFVAKAPDSADHLNLSSVVSKWTTYEPMYCVQSVNGRRIVLEAYGANTVQNTGSHRGYGGATENVPTYRIDTLNVNGGGYTGVALASGTSGFPRIATGGWNRTDMSTQTGLTLFTSIPNGNGYPIRSYTRASHFGLFRGNFNIYGIGGVENDIGVFHSGSSRLYVSDTNAFACKADVLSVIDSNAASLSTGLNVNALILDGNLFTTTLGTNSVVGRIRANNCSITPLSLAIGSRVGVLEAKGNVGHGVNILDGAYVENLTSVSNTVYGVNLGASRDVVIMSGSTSGNTSGGVYVTSGTCKLLNFTMAETTKATAAGYGGRIFSGSESGSSALNYQYAYGGLISSQTAVRHSASGIAWKLSPTNSTAIIENYPLTFKVATFAVFANAAFSVIAWMRRDNVGLTLRLVCRGAQLQGLSTSMSTLTVTNEWRRRTVSGTPTESGTVEVWAEAWGGSTYNGYVDDITITQS